MDDWITVVGNYVNMMVVMMVYLLGSEVQACLASSTNSFLLLLVRHLLLEAMHLLPIASCYY